MIKLFQTLLLLFAIITGAHAGEQAFTQSAFDRLQKEGQPLLIFIHADWCPTCRAQDPIVSKLLKQDEFQRITAFRVDFDRQKNVVNAFKAVMQSTLIAFKNGKEVGRSTGDTSESGIAALLRKAL